MRQWWLIKSDNFDTVLFFKVLWKAVMQYFCFSGFDPLTYGAVHMLLDLFRNDIANNTCFEGVDVS